MRIRRGLTGVTTAGLLASGTLVAAGPAEAAKPERTTISEPFSFVDADYCGEGIEVEIEGLFESRLQIHDRRGLDYFIEHQVVTQTHTLGDTSISLVTKPMFKDLKIVDQGSTLLITVLGTGPESVYGPDGKAIARNPGQFRFQVTIDEQTGEEVEGSFTVLKDSTGRTDDFCAVVVPVLQG